MYYTDSLPPHQSFSGRGEEHPQPSLAYMVRGGASAVMIPPDVLAMIDDAKHNGWGAQAASWAEKHTGRLVLFMVLFMGALGIFLSVLTHPALSPSYEKNTREHAQTQTNSAVFSGTEVQPIGGDSSTGISDAVMSGESFTEVTRRGEGITHLARRALAMRIAERDIHLAKEQLVYAEDYVQNAIGAHALKVGEKLSFTQELLDEATEKALALSADQIEHIKKYAQKVAWE